MFREPDELSRVAESILNEAKLDTSYYFSINDDPPSGRGEWGFALDKMPMTPSQWASFEKSGTIVYLTGDFTKVSAEVLKNNPRAQVIYLLP